MIHSIVDTDFYKLTQHIAVMSNYPNVEVVYRFNDRNNLTYPDGFDIKLKECLYQAQELTLTEAEEKGLRNIDEIPEWYIDFLKKFRFNAESVNIDFTDNKLNIDIRGMLYDEFLWDIPLMAIISELYFKETGQIVDIHSHTMSDVIKFMEMDEAGVNYAEFGTRRRYSYDNQKRILDILTSGSKNRGFIGTSNVHFSIIHNLKPIGTHAHEWIMINAAFNGYKYANRISMEKWLETFNGKLAIALTDTYGTKDFLKNFNEDLSNRYLGTRQDSGDPKEFYDHFKNHYKNLGIDLSSKTIVFSNGLNKDSAIDINYYCSETHNVCGMGTSITNDVGVKPLNIVVKIYSLTIDGEIKHCVKLSDDYGKSAGEPNEVELCKKEIEI